MDVFSIIASLGGGLIGAYMGALPAFIMCGVAAAIGGFMNMAGLVGDVAVGIFAFGPFFLPAIAFAGGVAASAYAHNKYPEIHKAGNDIVTCLWGLGKPDVLIVGMVFGLAGHIVHQCFQMLATAASISIDAGATVWLSGVVARLAFGKTGLTGKPEDPSKRVWFSGGAGLANNIILGAGLGIVIAGAGKLMSDAGVPMGSYHVVMFGLAAISLLFAQMGGACPGVHHIVLPSALALVMSGSMIVGIIFGILGSLIGDFAGCTFNSHCDSHIDPPAFTITVTVLIISIVWPVAATGINW